MFHAVPSSKPQNNLNGTPTHISHLQHYFQRKVNHSIPQNVCLSITHFLIHSLFPSANDKLIKHCTVCFHSIDQTVRRTSLPAPMACASQATGYVTGSTTVETTAMSCNAVSFGFLFFMFISVSL